MEVLSDVAQVPVATVTDGDNSILIHEKENGKLTEAPSVDDPIKFGSVETDEQTKEPDSHIDVSEANIRKDAVDEWPEPKQIHTFFFIRYRPYDDPKLKTKLDLADKEIQKKKQSRLQITDSLKAKRSDRAQVISQLKSLTAEDKQFRMVVDEKRKELEPLQDALGKLRGPNNTSRERGFGLCSSEAQLDELIQSLNNRIQHESIPLKEEKQIIREINQLQGTREQVIANAAMRAKIQESLGQKEEIQDQVKLMGVDLVGVKKEKQAIRAKIMSLEGELKAIDNGIKSLQAELELATQNLDKAFESLHELRNQRDGGNAYFYQNRSLLNKARELAAKKDLSSLEELSQIEMDAFMTLWSSNKDFRDDYEKRILRSLDSRELSRDGRIRNPNEKPVMAVEATKPLETEKMTKVNPKQPKEDSKPLPKQDSKEGTDKVTVDSRPNSKPVDKESKEEEKNLGLEKPQKDSSTKSEVDPAKLKEMKREEEIAKAKLALERKKKLAEKAAAKAAVRAQKEAEKKLKEREKKAKKKAAAAVTTNNPDEPTEPAVVDLAEREKSSEETDTQVPPNSNKDHKENNTIRERRRQRGPVSRPKVNLKRKKSINYWVWAAPASLFVVLLLVLGYQYLM